MQRPHHQAVVENDDVSVQRAAKKARLDADASAQPRSASTSMQAPSRSGALDGENSASEPLFSSSSDANGAAAAAFNPRGVLVKVGEGGTYGRFWCEAAHVRYMDFTQLLTALHDDSFFGGAVRRLILGVSSVYVRKGGIPPGSVVPPPGEAVDDSTFVKLEGGMTVREAIKEGKCTGNWLCVRVDGPLVPGASAVPQTSAMVQEAIQLRNGILALTGLATIPGRESNARLLRLPIGIGWPQLGPQPLFVRDFYEALYEGPLASLDQEGTATIRKFTITGNAGIGKSAFGCYLLWRAIHARRTVVYVSAEEERTRIFYADGKVEACDFYPGGGLPSDLLDDKRTVFIVDGAKPRSCAAFTILLTLPQRSRWKEFAKDADSVVLTMPVFSEGEIWDLKAAAFSGLDDGGVADRYSWWGGIPRFVLAKTTALDQVGLGAALTKVNLFELAKHIGATEIENETAVSHRLVHLKCRGELPSPPSPRSMEFYHLAKMTFASRRVKEAVVKSMMADKHNELSDLFRSGLANPHLATIYGDLYEHPALKMLMSGATFSCQRLINRDERRSGATVVGSISFTACPDHSFFSTVDALPSMSASSPSSALVPRSENFAGVDAILPSCEITVGDDSTAGPCLVNFTINPSHSLILKGSGNKANEGVYPVADALDIPPEAPIIFCWVLPSERYDDVCRKGTPLPVVKLPEGSPRRQRTILQYAVKVDVSSLMFAPPCDVCGAGKAEAAAGGSSA